MVLVRAGRAGLDLSDQIIAKLGTHNPLVMPMSTSEYAWLFDNTGFYNGTEWRGEFLCAVYEKDSAKGLSDAVAHIAEEVGLGKGDKAEATIAARVEPFLDQIGRLKTVTVDFGGLGLLQLGPTGLDGTSNNELPIPGNQWNDGHWSTAKVVAEDGSNDGMTTLFAGPEGWGLISGPLFSQFILIFPLLEYPSSRRSFTDLTKDIDDTIKITQTRDRIGLLKNTFVNEPQPVADMPDLYKRIRATVNPVTIYLSASPFSLYPMLRKFTNDYYPPGTVMLRDMTWMDISSFVATLTEGVQDYKQDQMEKIHTWLPGRKWVMIGDSTQKDPESYGTL